MKEIFTGFGTRVFRGLQARRTSVVTGDSDFNWRTLEGEVMRRLMGDAWVGLRDFRVQRTIRRALTRLRRDIEKSLGGTYCLQSLGDEAYLSVNQKAGILVYALACFEPTRKLLEPFRSKINGPSVRPSDETTSALNALQNGCRDFVGIGPDITATCCAEFCHYVPLDTFLDHISYKDSSGAYHSATGNAWLRELERAEVNRSPDFLAELEGSVREHVFSTLGEWVDTGGATGADLTEKVRDELGCPHFEGRQLVEIRFPVSAVRSGKLKKPTFADAGGYPPFLPSRRDDPYGYARDLRHDGERGGPEVWHQTLLAYAAGFRLLPEPKMALPSGIWKQIADTARQAREAARRSMTRST